ncbi:MAG: hypothetical protein JW985_01120 [Alphaproteobacteria bacterium]|nr:hypothetical protein [Alphaproteobacteria bacterium]
MPKPVNGIDFHMKTIIVLDPTEIVFRKFENTLKEQSMKYFGFLKSNTLATCYKFGIFQDYLKENVLEITANHIINNPNLLSGAQNAFDYFASLGKNIEIFAYSDIKNPVLSKRLVEQYSKIPSMGVIGRYLFPTKIDNMSDILSEIRFEFLRANVLFVTSDIHGVSAAKEEGITPVIVTDRINEQMLARKYRALCAENLELFAKQIKNGYLANMY